MEDIQKIQDSKQDETVKKTFLNVSLFVVRVLAYLAISTILVLIFVPILLSSFVHKPVSKKDPNSPQTRLERDYQQFPEKYHNTPCVPMNFDGKDFCLAKKQFATKHLKISLITRSESPNKVTGFEAVYRQQGIERKDHLPTRFLVNQFSPTPEAIVKRHFKIDGFNVSKDPKKLAKNTALFNTLVKQHENGLFDYTHIRYAGLTGELSTSSYAYVKNGHVSAQITYYNPRFICRFCYDTVIYDMPQLHSVLLIHEASTFEPKNPAQHLLSLAQKIEASILNSQVKRQTEGNH